MAPMKLVTLEGGRKPLVDSSEPISDLCSPVDKVESQDSVLRLDTSLRQQNRQEVCQTRIRAALYLDVRPTYM
jgi:hypothetical protein